MKPSLLKFFIFRNSRETDYSVKRPDNWGLLPPLAISPDYYLIKNSKGDDNYKRIFFFILAEMAILFKFVFRNLRNRICPLWK